MLIVTFFPQNKQGKSQKLKFIKDLIIFRPTM